MRKEIFPVDCADLRISVLALICKVFLKYSLYICTCKILYSQLIMDLQ